MSDLDKLAEMVEAIRKESDGGGYGFGDSEIRFLTGHLPKLIDLARALGAVANARGPIHSPERQRAVVALWTAKRALDGSLRGLSRDVEKA